MDTPAKGDHNNWASYWKKRARRASTNRAMAGFSKVRGIVSQGLNGGAGDGPDQHAVSVILSHATLESTRTIGDDQP